MTMPASNKCCLNWLVSSAFSRNYAHNRRMRKERVSSRSQLNKRKRIRSRFRMKSRSKSRTQCQSIFKSELPALGMG